MKSKEAAAVREYKAILAAQRKAAPAEQWTYGAAIRAALARVQVEREAAAVRQ